MAKARRPHGDVIRAVDFAELSLAGQWDAVNAEVLSCPTVQASMDHDHQLERHSISNVKPVELRAAHGAAD